MFSCNAFVFSCMFISAVVHVSMGLLVSLVLRIGMMAEERRGVFGSSGGGSEQKEL